jgi:hypothetical protein
MVLGAPMRNNIAFAALLFLVTPMFGQHGGGAKGTAAGGGRISARPIAGRRFGFSGNRPAARQRFGNEFVAPYLPIGGDYLGGTYLGEGDPQDLASYDSYYPPAPNFLSVRPPARPLVAHAVVNEYNWKDAGVAAGSTSSPTFTIALKDGSLHYAAATWLQNSQLYYIDSEGKQEVLSSNRIDRSATERLNEEKKLRLQLPPG